MYKNYFRTLMVAIVVLFLAGCAGMSPREQRMLSGGAIGATGGAIIGAATGSAATGAAIGGAAGVVGGLVVDEMDRSRYR
jgi:osmotically inducible lipoprotein OsmB